MDITGLIALVVMAALTMGTTNLFRSGKRRRGAVMIIAAALTGGVMGVINDDGTTRAAVIGPIGRFLRKTTLRENGS